MRIDNKQLKSFLLDSGILDEKEIEDVIVEEAISYIENKLIK